MNHYLYWLQELRPKIEQIKWKPLGLVLGLSFVVASVVSVVLSALLVPDYMKAPPRAQVDQSFAGVESFGETLKEPDLKLILDRNLFNKEGALGDSDPNAPQEDVGNTIRKTELPVKLLGVIYGGTPFNGLATIENTEKQKINSFIVGDYLTKEAKVIEIHRTRVILDREGRLEFIEMERAELVRTARQGKQKTDGKKSSQGYSPIAKGPPPKVFKEEGFERTDNSMIMSASYKDKMLTQDFAQVLQDAKAEPNMVDGQIRGFRLTRIRENSIWQKGGFQNDDVVEEVNGTSLTDPAGAIRLLQQMRNEKDFEVVIKRNGAPVTLKLSVQ